MGYLLPVIVAAVGIGLYRLRNIGHRPKGLPPGPPTVWLLGNIPHLEKNNPERKFTELAKEYGPIYSILIGSQIKIAVTSDKIVKELLDKRSAIYSSRYGGFIAGIMKEGNAIATMPYGDKWRLVRRHVHDLLQQRAADSYQPYLDLETKQLLFDLLTDAPPSGSAQIRWVEHVRRTTTSQTTQMVFGVRASSLQDKSLLEIYNVIMDAADIWMNPLRVLFDSYPVLQWVPTWLSPPRRDAVAMRAHEKKYFSGLWRDAKERVRKGTAMPCFCAGLVAAQEKDPAVTDDLAEGTICDVFEGGADTTASTFTGFIQAMLLFPDVQRAAWAELDAVCGEHMPEMADHDRLPFVRACVKEGFRWTPAIPLGVGHVAMRDDEYMGYKIPKGSEVLINTWGIHMDPARYPHPDRFDPRRFLGDDASAAQSALSVNPADRDHFVFGATRRICPGIHVADRTVFLLIARLLWAYEMVPPRDEHGREVLPDRLDLSDFILCPRPFGAVFVPRKGRDEVVKREWERCEELLDSHGQWKEMPSGVMLKEYVPDEKENLEV